VIHVDSPIILQCCRPSMHCFTEDHYVPKTGFISPHVSQLLCMIFFYEVFVCPGLTDAKRASRAQVVFQAFSANL
jgi:hypothetical protein